MGIYSTVVITSVHGPSFILQYLSALLQIEHVAWPYSPELLEDLPTHNYDVLYMSSGVLLFSGPDSSCLVTALLRLDSNIHVHVYMHYKNNLLA